MEAELMVAIMLELLTKGPEVVGAWWKTCENNVPTRQDVLMLQAMETPDEILGPPDKGEGG